MSTLNCAKRTTKPALLASQVDTRIKKVVDSGEAKSALLEEQKQRRAARRRLVGGGELFCCFPTRLSVPGTKLCPSSVQSIPLTPCALVIISLHRGASKAGNGDRSSSSRGAPSTMRPCRDAAEREGRTRGERGQGRGPLAGAAGTAAVSCGASAAALIVHPVSRSSPFALVSTSIQQ